MFFKSIVFGDQIFKHITYSMTYPQILKEGGNEYKFLMKLYSIVNIGILHWPLGVECGASIFQ